MANENITDETTVKLSAFVADDDSPNDNTYIVIIQQDSNGNDTVYSNKAIPWSKFVKDLNLDQYLKEDSGGSTTTADLIKGMIKDINNLDNYTKTTDLPTKLTNYYVSNSSDNSGAKKITCGSNLPQDSDGNNGDIYLKYN